MLGLFVRGKEFLRLPVETVNRKVQMPPESKGWKFVTASDDPAVLDIFESRRKPAAPAAPAEPKS